MAWKHNGPKGPVSEAICASDAWIEMYRDLREEPVETDHCKACQDLCCPADVATRHVIPKISTKILASGLMTLSVHMLRVFKRNTGITASSVKGLSRTELVRCCKELIDESQDTRQMLGISLRHCLW